MSNTGKVYFIPVLHQLHKSNPAYNYDTLKNVIDRLSPDIILTEIRPEDMDMDSSYLAANYPYEMHVVSKWFPFVRVEGFDWLGRDLEGRPVPGNYWKDLSEIKRLQRLLAADTVFKERSTHCYTNTSKRDSVLKYGSLEQILDPAMGKIVEDQYECFEKISRGTPYHLLAEFYRERNDSILARVNRMVSMNPGKRIAIITGDDHFQLLRDELKHDPIFE